MGEVEEVLEEEDEVRRGSWVVGMDCGAQGDAVQDAWGCFDVRANARRYGGADHGSGCSTDSWGATTVYTWTAECCAGVRFVPFSSCHPTTVAWFFEGTG